MDKRTFNSFENIGFMVIYILNRVLDHRGLMNPALHHTDSTTEFHPIGNKEVEYFFASDARYDG